MRKLTITMAAVAALFHLQFARAEDSIVVTANRMWLVQNLDASMGKLVEHGKALSLMTVTSKDDRTNLTTLNFIALDMFDGISNIRDFMHLSTVMVNKKDKAEVNRLLDRSRVNFDKNCSESVEMVNQLIGYIQSSALILEGKQLGEELNAICNQIRTTK